jgi:tRNA-intron endonuclease
VKTGFKYGSEFRLYERGKSPGEGHSNYLVKVANENNEFLMSDLSSYVRVAHGVNKKLLFAVVDDENDITYYNVEWTRP